MNNVMKAIPEWFTAVKSGELESWVPIALVALLVALYWVARLLLIGVWWLFRRVQRRRERRGVPGLPLSWAQLARPTAFLMMIGLHRLAALRMPMPHEFRADYEWGTRVLLMLGVVWWMWSVVDLIAESIRNRLQASYPRTAASMYVLGRRLLKGVAIGVALLIGLAAVGVNLSATLAGLGIGGLAIAFAAQKTLENVFGGLSVLSDRSLLVGDFCQLGKFVGEVEDVGLRTTSLRTLARTLVHVPNGVLATMEFENFSRRDKFLFNPMVAVHYETTREQLDAVLAGIRTLLGADPRVEAGTWRARLVKFGSSSIDIEVFAYLRTPDYVSFLAAQEELLLAVMTVVQNAGTAMAVPTQTMYMRGDAPPVQPE